MSSITQEDIDALHQSPRSANDTDVTELCEKVSELQAEVERQKRLYTRQAELADVVQQRHDVMQTEIEQLNHRIAWFDENESRLQAEVAGLNAMREADAEVAYSLRAERDQLLEKYALVQSWEASSREVFQHIEELISGHDSFVCQDVQWVINQHLRPNGRDPNCEACHGDGEYLGHSPNCDDDLCALNGDMYSCVGEVVQCDCTPAPTGELSAGVDLDGNIVEYRRVPAPTECGACDNSDPCTNQYGICSRKGGQPAPTSGEQSKKGCIHCGSHPLWTERGRCEDCGKYQTSDGRYDDL